MSNANDYLIIFAVLSNVSAIIICYYFLSRLLEEKSYSNMIKYSILFGLTFIFIGILLFYKQSIFFMLLSIIIFPLISLLLFQGNVLNRIIYGLLFLAFGSICEMVTGTIISIIFSFEISDLHLYPIYYLIVVIISKVILFAMIYILLKIVKKDIKSSSFMMWLALFSIPIVSLIVIYNLYLMTFNIENGNNIAIWAIVTMSFINIVFFVILKIMRNDAEKTIQYKNANIQLELEQKHYKEMLEKNHEVRALWHDMKNQMITIQYALDRQAYDETKDHIIQIREILDDAMEHNKSGNIAVDAIINNKIKLAANNQINFFHSIAIPGTLPINNIDLSIILGNILDNAIEACQRDCRIENDKIIQFNMQYKEGILLIDIENTFDGTTIKKLKGVFISSKEKKAIRIGYGISNVKQVLKNYEGNMIVRTIDDRFKCTILIPLSEN